MNTALDTQNRDVVRISTMCEIYEVLIIYKHLQVQKSMIIVLKKCE